MTEIVYIRGKKLQNLLMENNITQKDFLSDARHTDV